MTYADAPQASADEDELAPPDHIADNDIEQARRYQWVREVVLVGVFYYVYQIVRSLANHGNIVPKAIGNANRIVRWEEALNIDIEHRVQRAFLSFRWFIKIMNIYYGTLHFLITAGLLIWVYHFRRQAYRRMRNLLGLTTALALVGYWSFPLAPPRVYPNNKFVDTLDTIGGLWSYQSSAAKAVANPFAAMPSLHFGWALWCGIVFFTLTWHWLARTMSVVYPTITLFAVVVTANHYILDAVGGALILLAAVAVLRLVGGPATTPHRDRLEPTFQADAADTAYADAPLSSRR